MAAKIVITGASGRLGRVVGEGLAAGARSLLLTDIADPPQPLPRGAEFRRIDLTDKAAMLALAPETAAVVHFGALPAERSFEEILGPNVIGTYHAFELARLAGARMIFASSNHVIGFHERGTLLDEDSVMRPDGFYGLSKCYGELMGRLYWDKHGVESLSIRIGSARPEPRDVRQLRTWISHDDLVRLVEAGLAAEGLGCRVAWGISGNTRRWWRDNGAESLGYKPQDDAERYADALDPAEPGSGPVALRYQGGGFCAEGYSRDEPSPADIFAWMKDR